MELISALQKYNSFILKSLIIQWNQGCQVVLAVTLTELDTICYIYIVYKHIQR